MRRVSFKSVLWGAARQVGLAPDAEGLDRPIAAQLVESINSAMKLAWEYYDWPTLCVYATFPVEEDVTLEGVVLRRFVSYQTVSGYDQIGHVVEIWDQDPRQTRNAQRLSWAVGADSVDLLPCTCGTSPAAVVIRHRPLPPVFTDATYTARLYSRGESVYDPVTGECYVCYSIVTPGPTPPPVVDGEPANTDIWSVIPMPRFLGEAVKSGAAAGFNRAEGQAGAALNIEATMVAWLDHEITQLLQQGQTKTYLQ